MNYVIVSFKSRNSLFYFVKAIRQYNVSSEIINTPRIISKSCGLSAKINYSNFSIIVRTIQQLKLTDFNGVYSIQKQGFQERLQRLY